MYDKRTLLLSTLLRNCLPLSNSPAKQAHAQILVHGFLRNTTLQTDLLLVYSRCGFIHDARKVFDNMSNRNMHSWNILIASYVQNSLFFEALDVFDKLRKMDIRPDHYTLPPLFKASGGIGDIFMGKMLHCWVIRLGFQGYIIMDSSVLDFYAKCGVIFDAKMVFSNMQCRDSVVWNSMISGFGRSGLHDDAVRCFRDMLRDGVMIDSMTVPSVLNACGGYGNLMKGREIHGKVIKSPVFHLDIAIGNSLIDMYSKCGCLHGSEKVFGNQRSSNLITWTTMISSFGVHGKGEKSLSLFRKMKNFGLKPNSVTLTAILASCSHSGLIDQGWRIFKSIRSDYGIEPGIEHYACMVDLLGRFGYLKEAFELTKEMKFVATASIWGALLSGCMMHNNVEIGEIAAQKLFELEPTNSSNYVALCTIYDSLGLLNEVSKTRAKMRSLGLIKIPGCSWTTITGTVHKFYQGSHFHPLVMNVHESLDAVIKAPMLPYDWGLLNE